MPLYNPSGATIYVGFGSDETQFTIANNQAVAANITGLILDKNTYRDARIEMSITRQTASVTELRCYKTVIPYYENGAWAINQSDDGSDAGVTISIDSSTGQLKYTSTNMAGLSYVGKMRYKIVNTFFVET